MLFVTDPEECERLALLCLDPSKRLILIDDENHPTKWWNGTVVVPGTDERFTEAGSWEFTAAAIRAKHAIRIIRLREPFKGIGYVIKVPVKELGTDIYIKLTYNAKATKVIGRSFHYDTE